MYKKLFIVLMMGLILPGISIAQEGVLDRPADGVLQEREMELRQAVELPHVRHSDVLWGKRVWLNIDVRESMNQALYFPEDPQGNYRSLMTVIQDALLDGEIRAFHSDDDSFRGNVLDARALFAALSREMELSRQDQGLPDTTVVIPFSPTQVTRYRIKEDWFIDKRRGKMDVRIVSLAPQREVRDPGTGEFIGFETLFWLPFEEIREVLANAPVYIRANDHQRLSYDDLFIRRFFSGTIYREQRPDGRVIAEYFDNELDRLLEAQRIREEIRNREIDLWHY